MMMKKTSWKVMSRKQRVRIIVQAAINLTLLVVMLLDLRRRPEGQIKGSKRLWTFLAFVQPFGPIAYFAFGRKR